MPRLPFQLKDLAERALPRSIIGWFIVCWGAFLLASVVAGALLLSLYGQSTTEQLRRASATIARGCDAIAARYRVLRHGPNASAA